MDNGGDVHLKGGKEDSNNENLLQVYYTHILCKIYEILKKILLNKKKQTPHGCLSQNEGGRGFKYMKSSYSFIIGKKCVHSVFKILSNYEKFIKI